MTVWDCLELTSKSTKSLWFIRIKLKILNEKKINNWNIQLFGIVILYSKWIYQ